jgi:ribosomal protein L11 methylase PrmA
MQFDGAQARTTRTQKYCKDLYGASSGCWKNFKDELSLFVSGQDVIDIGCGSNGGVSSYALAFGARAYTGIDINEFAVAQSERLFGNQPNVRFVWDDPAHFLRNHVRQGDKPVVVSTGVFDRVIMHDLFYAELLIEAIHQATPPNGITIHSVLGFHQDYYYAFLRQGFVDTQRGPSADFVVFRKR